MGFSLSGVVRRTRAFRPAVRAVTGGNLTQHTRWCHTAREPVKKWLHRGRAWFETRPVGAPHHEESFFDGTEETPHPEESFFDSTEETPHPEESFFDGTEETPHPDSLRLSSRPVLAAGRRELGRVLDPA